MTDSKRTWRVLVTGSRNLPDGNEVWAALDQQLADHGEITVVHGDCPTGADAAATAWAFSTPNVWEEGYPADWETCTEACFHKPLGKGGRNYCPAAGPRRNQHMVDLGADVCLAFPLGDSRGTKDCTQRAIDAGIPVIVYEKGRP